jgi:hypothetical protein
MGWHTEIKKFSASEPVLAGRAVVRQPWLRFPHWSPPSAQQEEIMKPQIPSSENRLLSGRVVRKIKKFIKKRVPGCTNIKGTVRPDWICMRVVSLESPLKAHKPLWGLNFFISLFEIETNLLLVRFTGCMESCPPIGCRTVI